MNRSTGAFLAGLLFLVSQADAQESEGARPAHRILGADRGHISIVGPDGKVEWEMPDRHQVHDLWRLPNGNFLTHISNTKVVEISPEKKIVWAYESTPKTGYNGPVEVHAFQRLDDGNTMIAESGNRRIIEVDKEGKIVKQIALTVDHPKAHSDTRLVRKLENGHYLVAHEADGKVREYDEAGKVVWLYTLDLDGRPRTGGHDGHGTDVYSAIRLPNGNTLIGGGNNNRVIEVNPEGKVVWSVGHDELPGIRLFWVTTVAVLPNGNVVFGNCHAGPDNPQLIEVTRDKKVVWTLKDHKTFGNDLAVARILDDAK